MESVPTGASRKPRQEIDRVTIRFAGDSGDGMQLVGNEFTRASAIAGNDLQTFPDFPAEIRAPTGTIAGVSGFQLQFSRNEVFTSGDAPDVLVAMNPAALKVNLNELVPGGTLIINEGAFTTANLEKAGFRGNPLRDGTIDKFRSHVIDISKLTAMALEGSGLTTKDVERCKNMFALGLMLWMYGRSTEATEKYLNEKFAKKPQVRDANLKVLKTGFNYGENAEMIASAFQVKQAPITKGKYKNLSGNEATALGIITACRLANLRGFLGSYPITPASEILHELSKHRRFGFTTFQAEDEIAGMASTVGAAYGGALAFTNTSGPGMALKQEAIGLAIMAELPMVIVNVQRGGPSTGLPTKTEQSDLFQAVLGRNGESPLPVLAAKSPSDCFDAVIEAARIAVRHMTPVILLTDGYIGLGQEPFRIPDIKELKPIDVKFRTDPDGFQAYAREEKTLARAWVRPGTPGLMHRIGGLEKDFLTGAVSHDPMNHEKMCRIRAEKVARVADFYEPTVVDGPRSGGTVVVGWGSTYGAITEAVKQLRAKGKTVSQIHLRHINPLPKDLGDLLKGFKQVLVPELNLGQLSFLLRGTYLVDAQGINKVQGKPWKITELVQRLEEKVR